MIEGAIFDLDGTLVNLPIDYDSLKEEFRQIAKKADFEPLTEVIAALDKETRNKLYEVWTNAELEALPNLTVNNNGMRLYKKYSKKPVVLVTMQGKEVINRVLEAFNLSFNAIFTREESLDRTEQIEMAVHKLGLKAENVLVVGDRESDAISARKVGCKFVKVR